MLISFLISCISVLRCYVSLPPVCNVCHVKNKMVHFVFHPLVYCTLTPLLSIRVFCLSQFDCVFIRLFVECICAN